MDAIITLQDEMHFTGLPTSGQVVHLDTKPTETGLRQGASPMELLLIALGGCTALDVISILRKKRQEVTGFEVRVHGDRAEDHPKSFTDITIEYVVRGVNIDPAAVARSIDLSTETYCSVHAMLHQAANITTTYTIIQE